MYRILSIEDSVEIQLILKKVLSPLCELFLSSTLERARVELSRVPFDLVILDIGLPDGDGLRFCSELKSTPVFSSIPVFILTSNHSIQEKTLGFQLGIEDFVVKPFEPIELRLRIESRLKKIQERKESQEILSIGRLKINYSCQRVALQLPDGDLSINLSSTEFKILVFLAKNKERVKSREQIISAVWTDGSHLSDRTIDSHISRIRKKLIKGNCVIEAVQNSGYRFTVLQEDLDSLMRVG